MAQADSGVAANIREARRDYDRATKLPRRLVEELSHTCTLSQQAWIGPARNRISKQFQPWLEKIVALKREEAQAIGYGKGVPYDALLDAFEPGMTAADVTRLFTPLRDELVKLIAAIRDSGRHPNREIITRSYPVEAQREFSIAAAQQIGFDFDEGRLESPPIRSAAGSAPATRGSRRGYDEHHFPGAFFGTLHEAGHGIYEQGLDRSAYGLPAGSACSLGIHESQSRMWENFVGRSRAFWEHFLSQGPAGVSRSARERRPLPISISPSTTCSRRSSASKPTRRRTTCTSSCGSSWNAR